MAVACSFRGLCLCVVSSLFLYSGALFKELLITNFNLKLLMPPPPKNNKASEHTSVEGL